MDGPSALSSKTLGQGPLKKLMACAAVCFPIFSVPIAILRPVHLPIHIRGVGVSSEVQKEPTHW